MADEKMSNAARMKTPRRKVSPRRFSRCHWRSLNPLRGTGSPLYAPIGERGVRGVCGRWVGVVTAVFSRMACGRKRSLDEDGGMDLAEVGTIGLRWDSDGIFRSISLRQQGE